MFHEVCGVKRPKENVDPASMAHSAEQIFLPRLYGAKRPQEKNDPEISVEVFGSEISVEVFEIREAPERTF